MNEAIRADGQDHVTMVYNDDRVGSVIVFVRADKTDNIRLWRARVEAFQTDIPAAAGGDQFVRGVPDLQGRHGLFALPTVLVARSFQELVPAAPPGGEWNMVQTVNADGWTLLGPPLRCIYRDNPEHRPTIGPWLDGTNFVTFPYNEPVRVELGHALVGIDAPSISGVSLDTRLGKDPSPPERDIKPEEGEYLQFILHLRSFFFLHSVDGSVLFFQVNWGYHLGLTGFTHDPKDTLGHLISDRPVVITNPGFLEQYFRAANANNLIRRARTWELTVCQPEPE